MCEPPLMLSIACPWSRMLLHDLRAMVSEHYRVRRNRFGPAVANPRQPDAMVARRKGRRHATQKGRRSHLPEDVGLPLFFVV